LLKIIGNGNPQQITSVFLTANGKVSHTYFRQRNS